MAERTRILNQMIDQLLNVKQRALKLPPEFRGVYESLFGLCGELRRTQKWLAVYPPERREGEDSAARG